MNKPFIHPTSVVDDSAVVTKSVPDYALVAGNPSRQIGWISHNGHRLEFDSDGKAQCPESGIRYRLINNQVYAE